MDMTPAEAYKTIAKHTFVAYPSLWADSNKARIIFANSLEDAVSIAKEAFNRANPSVHRIIGTGHPHVFIQN